MSDSAVIDTVTKHDLEQLIDCTENDMPSIRVVQMLASEVMRNRNIGNLIPEPEPELKQRCAVLLSNIKKDPRIGETLERMQGIFKESLGADLKQSVIDALTFVGGDEASISAGDWLEIDTTLLTRIEDIIHDETGFGGSHNPKNHNSVLNNLRMYVQNAEGSTRTLVPKAFIGQADGAISAIVYGRKYPEKAREQILRELRKLMGLEED